MSIKEKLELLAKKKHINWEPLDLEGSPMCRLILCGRPMRARAMIMW